MSQAASPRPLALYLVSLCLLALAANALPAGASLIADPSGSVLGMTLDVLAATPFPSFLIPGLFLFAVIGVGALLLLYALWARPASALLNRLLRATRQHWSWSFALVYGLVVVLWIVVQYC